MYCAMIILSEYIDVATCSTLVMESQSFAQLSFSTKNEMGRPLRQLFCAVPQELVKPQQQHLFVKSLVLRSLK